MSPAWPERGRRVGSPTPPSPRAATDNDWNAARHLREPIVRDPDRVQPFARQTASLLKQFVAIRLQATGFTVLRRSEDSHGRRDGGDTYRRRPVRQCSPLAACRSLEGFALLCPPEPSALAGSKPFPTATERGSTEFAEVRPPLLKPAVKVAGMAGNRKAGGDAANDVCGFVRRLDSIRQIDAETARAFGFKFIQMTGQRKRSFVG